MLSNNADWENLRNNARKTIDEKFSIQDYIIEYEENKKIIENNPYITRQDNLIQLRELKKELEENINQRKIEIFEEFDDIPKGTAKRYYYDIKPFIDDLKYKELI